MKNRKLLVLDIDGTLTNTQKDITPKTLEAILNIERMGHAVALASGRPTGGMRRYVDELELAKYGNYAISYNGACVTNMQTNEMVYKNALPDYVAPWMLDYAREHGLGMCIYDGNTVVCGTDVDRYIERETVLNGFNRVSVENFDAYRGMDMFKALLTAPPVRAAEHEKRLARRFIGRLSISLAASLLGVLAVLLFVPVVGLWGAVASLGAVQGLTLLLSLRALRRSGCIARSR